MLINHNVRPALPAPYVQLSWLVEMLNQAWHTNPKSRCTAGEMLRTFDENLSLIMLMAATGAEA
eukprot:gene30630-37875_t